MSTVPTQRSRMSIIVSPVRRLVAWFVDVVVGTTRRSVADDITGVASQFAYNAFLATIPFLFVIVTAIRLAGRGE